MKNIIIAVTLTLIIALSQMLSGCSPNYDGIIADSTKAIEKKPDDAEAYRERASAWDTTFEVTFTGRKAIMTKLSPTAPRP
jgi:hypothetical protein